MRGAGVIWSVLGALILWPLAVAATSPLLAWRDPIYVVSGFAGVIGFACMLLQPLLARGVLSKLDLAFGRRLHRWIGASLVAAVLVHVIGLWLTSPPDVVDALLLRSPTPFAVWGVLAMWALFAAATLVGVRRRLGWRLQTWRLVHTGLVAVAIVGTLLHVFLIEGTMGGVSKLALSGAVLAVASLVLGGIWRQAWRAGHAQRQA